MRAYAHVLACACLCVCVCVRAVRQAPVNLSDGDIIGIRDTAIGHQDFSTDWDARAQAAKAAKPSKEVQGRTEVAFKMTVTKGSKRGTESQATDQEASARHEVVLAAENVISPAESGRQERRPSVRDFFLSFPFHSFIEVGMQS